MQKTLIELAFEANIQKKEELRKELIAPAKKYISTTLDIPIGKIVEGDNLKVADGYCLFEPEVGLTFYYFPGSALSDNYVYTFESLRFKELDGREMSIPERIIESLDVLGEIIERERAYRNRNSVDAKEASPNFVATENVAATKEVKEKRWFEFWK